MFGRFLCWLGFHRRPPGLSKTWCFLWCCVRCSQLCPGRLGAKR